MEYTALKIQPSRFLELSPSIPVIDVRAPKEYLQGHIPGALNMPLFNDDERAEVGIAYTRTGSEAALLRGLEIAGPKLAEFVKQCREVAKSGEVLVHCWRGGMRSEAMAWLFTYSGFHTYVLEGGYRAYRRFIRDSFNRGTQVVVLGGMTGSGKTKILRYLYSLGEQVLDLEGLAHHKGSAFGALGQADQPTTEQFENNLASLWLTFNNEKRVWIEDESRNIGKVIIPETIFLKMTAAPLVFVDVAFEIRVKRLVAEYGSFNNADLAELIRKIGKRMGGDKAKAAIAALERGNLEESISAVLAYYDKAYQYGLSKHDKNRIMTNIPANADIQSTAEHIMNQIPNFNINF